MNWVHSLVIERIDYIEYDPDDYGQPEPLATVEVETLGLVQPRRATEVADPRGAGAQVSDHLIFLPDGTDVRGSDRIVWGDRRYAIDGIRPFEYGRLRHIEIDARLVTTADAQESGS